MWSQGWRCAECGERSTGVYPNRTVALADRRSCAQGHDMKRDRFPGRASRARRRGSEAEERAAFEARQTLPRGAALRTDGSQTTIVNSVFHTAEGVSAVETSDGGNLTVERVQHFVHPS